MNEPTPSLPEKKRHLTILQKSPLDASPENWGGETASAKVPSWVPSRFNVRATAVDGQMLLWNTLTNSLNAFKPEQVQHVLRLLRAEGTESEKNGLVGYLIDRGFLVQRGTDEYAKFLLSFGKQHYRTDHFELIPLSSEDCNFRCTYCYERFERGTMRPEVRRGIRRLLEGRIEKLNSFLVEWFGGEPLYGFEAIEDLAPFFKQICEEHKVHFSSRMTTNGYLLTPDVADKVLGWGINGFQITLDGAPEDHDRTRPTRDGQSTFFTIYENLRALAARPDHFRVLLRINFDHSKMPRIDEYMDLLQKGFSKDSRFELHLHPIGKWGGPNDDNLKGLCSEGESRDLVAEMKNLASKRGLRIPTLKDANYLGGHVCFAARPYNFVVGTTGKLMKCTTVLDYEDHNVVGQLNEDGSIVLNEANMALWTAPSFTRDSQCQKCSVLPHCQGISCPLPRIQHNERPCITTRTNAKQELFEIPRYSPDHARERKVAVDGSCGGAGK